MQEFLGTSRGSSFSQKQNGSTGFFMETVRRNFSPVIMVVSTQSAEETCKKNNLSFVDIIRPHCALQNVNVPVRTASDQPYRIQDFHLRVYHSSDIAQPRTETAEEYLTQVVTDAGDEAAAELEGDPSDLTAVLRMASSESPTSWYHRYCQEFARTLAFSEHETIDHPVACLLVASSMDSNVVNTFVELYGPDSLPALFNEQAMDPKLLKYYVLLHDNQDGPSESAEGILQEMKSTFGANSCRILALNTGRPEGVPMADIWTPHMAQKIQPPPAIDSEPPPALSLVDADVASGDSAATAARGRFLAVEDIEEVAGFMLDLAAKHVIPHLETKIRDLNHQISAQRKGLKNQIKNLWFRKGKDEAQETASGLYTYSSQESQIRMLADYAFMLRDYELALSNYRLVSGDYKTDKVWKRYAGTQEMIGLCLFMLNQSLREMEFAMESAYSYYQRSGSTNASYATRAVLWFVEMYKSKSMFREAAGVLMRASLEENNLRAGMLLEQAALCFLRSVPPMMRKYGFHMVLAGHRYNQCGQRKHAIRAYKHVVSVYEERGWNYINDHVHFALGRLSAYLGRSDSAVHFFMKLLSCTHQSSTVQITFLREFLYVVQSNVVGKGMGPLELDLPKVNVEHVYVHFEDHRTFASPAAAALKEQLWHDLEDGLVPAAGALPTWLDASKLRSGTNELVATNTCVAGEEVGVDVEFVNPLQVTIDISCVRLVCEFSPPTDADVLHGQEKKSITRATSSPALELDTGAAPSSTPSTPDQQPVSPTHHGHSHSQGSPYPRVVSMSDLSSEMPARASEEASEGAPEGREAGLGETVSADASTAEPVDLEPPFTLRDEAFSLKGGERTVVRLKAQPKREGTFRIIGVEWILANTAHGRRNFMIKGPKRRRPKGGGQFRDREHPPHLRLTFKVISPMPRLEVTLHGLPASVNEGEIHRLVLELSNSAAVSLKKLKLKTSHPTSLLVGQPGDLDLEFPACLEVSRRHPVPGRTSSPTPMGDVGTTKNGYIFTFPQTTVVEGGSTVLWPVWLHAREAGTHALNTVLFYEPATAVPGMKFRTLRITHKLQVQPSLSVTTRITPSPAHLSRYVLRLDVNNRHALEAFHVRQVSCSGGSWRIARLAGPNIGAAAALPDGPSPPDLLPPGQTSTMFFHLEAGGERESTDSAMEDASFAQSVALPSQLTLPDDADAPLLDIARGPLMRFHARERMVQPRPSKATPGRALIPVGENVLERPDASLLDVIVTWEQEGGPPGSNLASTLLDASRIGTHHLCHRSAMDDEPVRWVLEGPVSLYHDFSLAAVCELPLSLLVRNCSASIASVRVDAIDPALFASLHPAESAGLGPTLPTSPRSPTSSSGGPPRGGWYLPPTPPGTGDVSTRNVGTVFGAAEQLLCGTPPCGSFMWSGTTCSITRNILPGAQIRVPLQVVLFAPGVYDVSAYKVTWELTADVRKKTVPTPTPEGRRGRGSSTSQSPLPSPRARLPPKPSAPPALSKTPTGGDAQKSGTGKDAKVGFEIKGSPVKDETPVVEKSGVGFGHSFLVMVGEAPKTSIELL